MENIPTAEEALKAEFWNGSQIEIHSGDLPEIIKVINKQSELHVKAALEAAAEKARLHYSDEKCPNNNEIVESYHGNEGLNEDPVVVTIYKDSILNAYPLENIK